ncbi:MAG: SHOCT domain-containing protein [Patescibacteria group bacterium]|nr:SHOCT domain-containing protein [Patescibacteria group bacterium]
MFILWIILAALAVWLIVEAGRRSRGYRDNLSQQQKNTALDLLNQRYAKGEISKEEYQQKKKDILS